jgi:formylmethanofuran dehydrogenase subunit E
MERKDNCDNCGGDMKEDAQFGIDGQVICQDCAMAHTAMKALETAEFEEFHRGLGTLE